MAIWLDGTETSRVARAAPVPDPRAQYIAGLRALANLLETQPDLVLPGVGGKGLNVFVQTKVELAAWVRALPGKKTKLVDDHSVTVTGQLGGLGIKLNAYRGEVCERVVVATREVTEQVPDPDALASVPTVTVTRTEEIAEWVCTPILDEADPR